VDGPDDYDDDGKEGKYKYSQPSLCASNSLILKIIFHGEAVPFFPSLASPTVTEKQKKRRKVGSIKIEFSSTV
jgi:hypothetical protein